jgi:hypothetical protein
VGRLFCRANEKLLPERVEVRKQKATPLGVASFGNYLFPLPPPDGLPVVLGAFTNPLLFAMLFEF